MPRKLLPPLTLFLCLIFAASGAFALSFDIPQNGTTLLSEIPDSRIVSILNTAEATAKTYQYRMNFSTDGDFSRDLKADVAQQADFLLESYLACASPALGGAGGDLDAFGSRDIPSGRWSNTLWGGIQAPYYHNQLWMLSSNGTRYTVSAHAFLFQLGAQYSSDNYTFQELPAASLTGTNDENVEEPTPLQVHLSANAGSALVKGLNAPIDPVVGAWLLHGDGEYTEPVRLSFGNNWHTFHDDAPAALFNSNITNPGNASYSSIVSSVRSDTFALLNTPLLAECYDFSPYAFIWLTISEVSDASDLPETGDSFPLAPWLLLGGAFALLALRSKAKRASSI